MLSKRVWLLVGILGLTTAYGSSQTKVTISYRQAPIVQVLISLAAAGQMNIVIAPEVQGEVSLQLTEVSWQTAIELVAELANLQIQRRDNLLLVSGIIRDNLSPNLSQHNFAASKAGTLTQHMAILNYADARQVAEKLTSLQPPLLTAQGKITVEAERNQLLIWDNSSVFPGIKLWLDRQDQPLPQIEISAQIINIDEEYLHELGVAWQAVNRLGQNTSTISMPLGISRPSFVAGVTIAHIRGDLLRLELSALEQEHKVEIIASPRLITANRATASIKQGMEIPYLVARKRDEIPTVEFREAVLGMEVTPELIGEHRVRLKIHLSQNVPSSRLQTSQEGTPPSINKQEIDTEVIAQNGETLALGGIFQQQRTLGEERVPILSDIPGLGALFRHDKHQHKKRELIIFITPILRLPQTFSTAPRIANWNVDDE